MSGDTTSSKTTWAHAARSVDKLDKTAKDGAANDQAASDLVGRDVFGPALFGSALFGRHQIRMDRAGRALATRDMTEYVGAAHEATADAKAAAEVPTAAVRGAGWLLVDRTRSVAAAFRSPLLKSRAALGGVGAPRGSAGTPRTSLLARGALVIVERVVRSGERCSLYGGSTPR